MTEEEFLRKSEEIYQTYIADESVKMGLGDGISEILAFDLFNLLLEFKGVEE